MSQEVMRERWFPTIDILEDGAVYARIGPDVFSPGNLAQARTFVLTDELSYTAGIHNLLAGFQFEYNKATNGSSKQVMDTMCIFMGQLRK